MISNSLRRPSFSTFARLVVFLATCALLAGCGRSDSYRYKLTLSVDTPDGVKTGFSVVEMYAWDVSIPARGTMSTARGEAVYVDLGPGQRPLVAVMTLYRAKKAGMIWAERKPDSQYLLALYGEPKPDPEFFSRISRLKKHRGVRGLDPRDLPDLVTFADTNDPRSVMAVDPQNLPASLGPGVTWRATTIEVTDEPITWTIETKLPWLKGLTGGLDGEKLRFYGEKASFANSLNQTSFIQRKP
jgi:hypothetical protein